MVRRAESLLEGQDDIIRLLVRRAVNDGNWDGAGGLHAAEGGRFRAVAVHIDLLDLVRNLFELQHRPDCED